MIIRPTSRQDPEDVAGKMPAFVFNITSLLSRDLLEVVMVAGIISLPVVWFAASAWLNTFAFRIQLTWDIFTLPVVTLTGICLLTVTTHILRGVNANPANVLKSE